MIRKNILFVGLAIFLTSNASFGEGKKNLAERPSEKNSIGSASKKAGAKFIKVKVIVYKKDTLAKILRRFVREDSLITKKEGMVKKTLESNPQIKNWRKLVAGETIYIYLAPKFLDSKKMKAFRKDVKKVSRKIVKKLKTTKDKDSEKVKRWSVFYMSSMGQFSQEKSSLAKVNFKQNSPITLGAMHTYYPKKGKYTVSSSTYFSYLVAASSNLDEANVEVPLEIGFNSYYQYPFSKGSYNLYGGFDFEKFNTFNLPGVDSGDSLSFDENQLGFLTVGYSKAFKVMKRMLLFKTSISQSIFSTRKVAYSGDTDSSTYSGNKLMLFLLTRVGKQYFVSSLLKYHTLTGPSDVIGLRVGIGGGYLF